MSLSAQTLDELVKPHLKTEWDTVKRQWFPSEENYAHDLREPGEFCLVTTNILVYWN